MACSVENIIKNFNEIIDTSIKGNAMSIKQDKKGDFHITWNPAYRIKTKTQAVRVAEQKVRTATQLLDNEGYNSPVFGPYLSIDETLQDEVTINKIEPKKLVRALELRNQAEEQQVEVETLVTEQEQEFFNQQAEDQAILSQQNDNQWIEPDGLPAIQPRCN